MSKKTIIISSIILSILTIISIIIIANTKKTTNENNTTKVVKKETKEKEIIEEDTKPELLNILIMGVDGGGFDNARSDVMMIASVDFENKSLKLTSVMRDTLSYIPTSNTYQKLNHSYFEGGPEETMLAINTNFDLNIEDYVVFNYESVKKVVDFVGGYPTDINEGEAKDMKLSPGHYVLKGKKVVDYMRIRYNSGGDTARNQRQRDLIIYVMDEMKNMDKKDILKFATKLMPTIKTSYSLLDIEELMDLYEIVKDDLIIEQYSFPFDYEGKKLTDKLWYAIPKTMETNVIELHKNIFNSTDYVPSNVVNEINKTIEEKSNVH